MHYVVGDLHGCLEVFIGLLQNVGLVNEDLEWSGADSQLWCLGDYADRGPDGIGVINLLMRLERQAREAGGAVNALMGNHDLMLLSAKRFSDVEVPSFKAQGHRITFRQIWQRVGGQTQDFERATEDHLHWLAERPALALAGDNLLMHADSLFYLELGDSIAAINATMHNLLHSDDVRIWDALADLFSNRFAFVNGGEDTAREVLNQLGGARIIHGHTPIYGLVGYPAQFITDPLIYNEGLCMNIDHCIFNGGPGFIVPLGDGTVNLAKEAD